DPPLLLADEPTGSLDAEAGQKVLSLLRAAAGERGRAVIVASHSDVVHSFADEILTLEDGKLL
ncbi:MAG: ABC transporter ATP-binding protein, partial [Rhodothermales bacterium]